MNNIFKKYSLKQAKFQLYSIGMFYGIPSPFYIFFVFPEHLDLMVIWLLSSLSFTTPINILFRHTLTWNRVKKWLEL